MKRTVLEVECSRCHRTEYVPAPPGDVPGARQGDPAVPSVLIVVDGQTLAKFDDLCDPCKKAVLGYVEQIAKPMEKKSPNRKKKGALEELADKKQAEAAASTTLHNGTGAKEKAHQHPPPAVVTRPR